MLIGFGFFLDRTPHFLSHSQSYLWEEQDIEIVLCVNEVAKAAHRISKQTFW